MYFYLKGYYGYKNLGDEFLLLGLLSRLKKTTETQGSIEKIMIETKDEKRLVNRLNNNQKYHGITSGILVVVGPTNKYKSDPNYIKILGGGEVLSDARPFPYNGRNYLIVNNGWGLRGINLITFSNAILQQRFWILGGIGTEKKRGTKWLYKQILGRAERIVVREKTSFDVAKKYNQKVELYHDFCFDLLQKIQPKKQSTANNNNETLLKDPAKAAISISPTPKKILINVNKYIRNESTKGKIIELTKQFTGADFWFMPAEIGSDDLLYPQIQAIIPTIQLYDWTQHTVEEICEFIRGMDYGLAARLHILLLLKYFNVQFSPIAYQEKVTKMLSEELT